MGQMNFSDLDWAAKKKTSRREKFLSEMNLVVPWQRLIALIAPHYPKAGAGRQPKPLEWMIRIYCLQQWYSLSDPGMEDALYDIESMRRFVGIKLASDAIPDETTLLNFRHLLEKHQLTETLFKGINTYPDEKKMHMKRGTIVDATLIAAPSSTKNKEKARDPEMSSSKKANQWYFGMKAHIGVDADSGLVHSMSTTTAKTHDKVEMDNLMHGEERAVFGDKGYVSDKDKRQSRQDGVYWGVLDKAKPQKKLSSTQKKRNRKHASIRAKVEHPFRVIKRQFGYMKTRYRGLAKNTAQLYALFGLANLYMAKRSLMQLQDQSA
ncbi:MAG: IS5 family transposase [Nitrospiria bacterium]